MPMSFCLQLTGAVMRSVKFYHEQARQERAKSASTDDEVARTMHLRLAQVYEQMAYETEIQLEQKRQERASDSANQPWSKGGKDQLES
ncbi:hypothetical protein G7077_02980 [Sphingomonas piscis]|uniref:Uncharacterized protein n=1 Tax=Sphingomonas piscis TaxID=2714943 RepID=A0A6G7YMT0_9SPHN|nr:hypothetical protein [Sphingomonas piscis]QIK78026.1 hypothetical protein G7077_02980 [Sphingomonas piscis]